METKIFYNYHDFHHLVQNYNGELILRVHNMDYDSQNNLIAKLIKE